MPMVRVEFHTEIKVNFFWGGCSDLNQRENSVTRHSRTLRDLTMYNLGYQKRCDHSK